MRLRRGNGKVGCAITRGIWLWGCYWKGMLATGLFTMGGFGPELVRKLAKISTKGWRTLESNDSSLEDDPIGKSGLASLNGNSTS